MRDVAMSSRSALRAADREPPRRIAPGQPLPGGRRASLRRGGPPSLNEEGPDAPTRRTPIRLRSAFPTQPLTASGDFHVTI